MIVMKLLVVGFGAMMVGAIQAHKGWTWSETGMFMTGLALMIGGASWKTL